MLAQSSWAWGSATFTMSAVLYSENTSLIQYYLFLFLLPFAPTRLSFASKSPFKMADLLSHVSTPSSGWRVNPPVSDIFTRMLIC